MDLRGSSPPASITAGAFAIPAARQSLPALKRRSSKSWLSLPWLFGRRHASGSHLRLHPAIALAEGALVVVFVYTLIGAGIGFAAGALVLGAVAGLTGGCCAVAAILLIRGSAIAAGTATSRPSDRKVPAASSR